MSDQEANWPWLLLSAHSEKVLHEKDAANLFIGLKSGFAKGSGEIHRSGRGACRSRPRSCSARSCCRCSMPSAAGGKLDYNREKRCAFDL